MKANLSIHVNFLYHSTVSESSLIIGGKLRERARHVRAGEAENQHAGGAEAAPSTGPQASPPAITPSVSRSGICTVSTAICVRVRDPHESSQVPGGTSQRTVAASPALQHPCLSRPNSTQRSTNWSTWWALAAAFGVQRMDADVVFRRGILFQPPRQQHRARPWLASKDQWLQPMRSLSHRIRWNPGLGTQPGHCPV